MTHTPTHTPGPWRIDTTRQNARPIMVDAPRKYGQGKFKDGQFAIAMVGFPASLSLEESEANARRIVASVNACEGISTEALEAGAIQELVAALEFYAASWLEPLEKGYIVRSGLGPEVARAALEKVRTQ